MTIYSGNNYRKIYESHFGPIPKDEQGRSYEIHHIDGNRNNNSIENLQCVSIQEHYDIHYKQGDWAACHLIATKSKLSPELISELSKKAQKERVYAGTHHLLGGELQSKTNKKQWKELGKKHPLYVHNQERLKNGTHNFLGSDLNQTRIEKGSHNFIQKWECSYCGKQGTNLALYKRWGHSDGTCLSPRTYIPKSADTKIYNWVNKITNEKVSLTRTELSRTYGLNPKEIWRVVNKRIKTTKGWGLDN